MRNRRFTTKVAGDGDERQKNYHLGNNNHVELTLFR